MRIIYAIILATAAVSFEGCKVEKDASAVDAAQVNEKRKLLGGGNTGGGLGLDEEGGNDEGASMTPSAKALAAAQKLFGEKKVKLDAARLAFASKEEEIAAKDRELMTARRELRDVTAAHAFEQRGCHSFRDLLIGDVVRGTIPALPNRGLLNAVESARHCNHNPEGLQASREAFNAIVETDLPAGDARLCRRQMITAIDNELAINVRDARRTLLDAIEVIGSIPDAVKDAAVALRAEFRSARLQRALVESITDDMNFHHPGLVQFRRKLQRAIAEMAARATLRGLLDAQDNIPDNVWRAWQAHNAPGANPQPVINEIFTARSSGAPLPAAGTRWANVLAADEALGRAISANIDRIGMDDARKKLVDFIMPADRNVVDGIVANGRALGDLLTADPVDAARVDAASNALSDSIGNANLDAGIAILNARNSWVTAIGRREYTDGQIAACTLTISGPGGAAAGLGTDDQFYDAIDVYNRESARSGGNLVAAQEALISAIPPSRRQPVARRYTDYTGAMDRVASSQRLMGERTQDVTAREGELAALRGTTAGLEAAVEAAASEYTEAESALVKLTKPADANAGEN